MQDDLVKALNRLYNIANTSRKTIGDVHGLADTFLKEFRKFGELALSEIGSLNRDVTDLQEQIDEIKKGIILSEENARRGRTPLDDDLVDFIRAEVAKLDKNGKPLYSQRRVADRAGVSKGAVQKYGAMPLDELESMRKKQAEKKAEREIPSPPIDPMKNIPKGPYKPATHPAVPKMKTSHEFVPPKESDDNG